MPLLRKTVFEKQEAPEYLRDDDEVFHCTITNEIFRDYHDFSERMFLCNSMVWTCSLTGKSNLTYQEAVDSEENAKKCLKVFSNELKIPILYLATLTKRTSFGEMADDILTYTNDRFFVGEKVEACFTANNWKDCYVISVIAPSEADLKKSPGGKSSLPNAALYKYEIEHVDSKDSDIREMMIVDSNHLRRSKTQFSRDKTKLFLKQNVEPDNRGIWVIKQESIDRYNIKEVQWETIFDGPPPTFQSSKNFGKATSKDVPNKKQKQETMSKYLKKNGLSMKKEVDPEQKNSLLESMKKREEDFKKQKQLNEEQKALEKQRKKEDAVKQAHYVKEWSKPKEDLELEDQVVLPDLVPVKSKVPDRYFGEMIAIMEFVETFPKLLTVNKFFPGGFTLELMERALSEKEVAGPLTDLIQMLLNAIFKCQEEESNSYNTGTEFVKEIKDDEISTTIDINQSALLATLASKWPTKYQGFNLNQLPLYSLTVSEILRLHLLASGARINDTGSRWRYAQRGGFTNEDDPGLHMRLHQSHILKALAVHNVVQMSINDKLQILSCLVNQILTYADVRDITEENVEKTKQVKLDIRSLKTAERKRGIELAAQKQKLKKEMTDEALKQAMDKLEATNEKKQEEFQKKLDKLRKMACEGQVFLGRDRAYRKYLKISSVPGIFVNWEDELAGVCLDKVTEQFPDLPNASRQDLMEHIRKTFDQQDKPSKKLNGTTNSLTSHSDIDISQKLLMCTANHKNCPVHTIKPNRQRWSFIPDRQTLEDLINALNKRGCREGELKETLKGNEDILLNYIWTTPQSVLNRDIEKNEDVEKTSKRKDKYEDANLGYPSDMTSEHVLENVLIENLLEMEEKIADGGLGTLKIKDRDTWRNLLQSKNYDEFGKLVPSGDKKAKSRKSETSESRSSTPELKDEYLDPGHFLGDTVEVQSDSDDSADVTLPQTNSKAIKSLASALCHISDAVEPRVLKKPLGKADVKPKDKQQRKPFDRLARWQKSLLAATSFSQIFLHYGTLDWCVMWSRSALLARCQICRRKNNSENMLLCDSCNMGHHMYCLKPKLTQVPQGDWFCDKCTEEREQKAKLLSPPVKKRRTIFVEEEVEEEEEQDSGNEEGGEEEDESSEAEAMDEESIIEEEKVKIELCKTCGSGGDIAQCEKCHCNYHKECVAPPLRRLPRAPWTCPGCSNNRKQREKVKENGYDSGSDEVVNRRSIRREDKREDLPLHNAVLQELLQDVMRHELAWPFLRPVQQKEVPDYFEIITEPMDFGTIKYKLNMGEYSTDAQVMRDVVLIFENCNTYNSNADEVYKCGVKLLSYFAKKAKELGLTLPPELQEDEDPKPKKRKTK